MKPAEPERDDEPVRVGIGIIGRDGRYLIRRRPPLPGSPMPGFWEFPGGKCHDGEGPRACAIRECREEVGIEIEPTRLRRVVRHMYPHGFVELHFFECVTVREDDEPAPGSGFEWVAVADLPSRRFPGANDTVVADLVAEDRARRAE
jgi:mutator protein MutT